MRKAGSARLLARDILRLPAMRAYLIRRLLQTLPTLGGVLLLTFLLFNAVGGSPAQLTLGEQASPAALEEFDEARGFNKPLFFGRWATTRALQDVRSPADWARALPAARIVSAESNVARLDPGAIAPLALRFPLRSGQAYRLVLRVRGGTGATFQGLELCSSGSSKAWKTRQEKTAENHERHEPHEKGEGFGNHERHELHEKGEGTGKQKNHEKDFSPWRTVRLDFTAGGPDVPAPAFQIGDEPLEMERLDLRRRMRTAFDSQLVAYVGRLARLDFGVSSRENQRVADILKQGIGPSLALTIPMFTGGVLLALLVSLVCVSAPCSWTDRSLTFLAVATMSVNYLVWIVAGQYLLGFKLGWFPIWGYESWRNLLLPALIGIVSGLGVNVRFYRTVLLEERHREYVRAALARGAGPARILFRHVLPNAAIPILTSISISLPFLYTGSLLLESFFGIPGLGYVGVNAIASSDPDVLRAVVLIGSVLYMAANLLTDVIYAVVDPRVRLS